LALLADYTLYTKETLFRITSMYHWALQRSDNVGVSINEEDRVVYRLTSIPHESFSAYESFSALVTALEASEDVPKAWNCNKEAFSSREEAEGKSIWWCR